MNSLPNTVFFGELEKLGLKDLLLTLKGDKLFIITDNNTGKHCLQYLLASVNALKTAAVLEFENGEENKGIETCMYIWRTLLQMGATRQSVIINLGGGVVSDLGGFIAGTYQRGIRYINIPTTLLAQADASVGAKVAIDLNEYKNMVGLFYDPVAVFIDTHFLISLSKREWLNGYAEMIKHALLESEEAWNEIINTSITNQKALEKILIRSVAFKHKTVQCDKHEAGLRKILNLGHTAGHAIESFYLENDKFKIKHGEAVIEGLIIELLIAQKKCGFPAEQFEIIVQYLREYFNSISIDKTDFSRLIQIMKSDKKNRGNEINFTLLSAIGKPLYDIPITAHEIEQALMRYRTL